MRKKILNFLFLFCLIGNQTEVLAKEGFKVMVYCNDDPLMAKRLENSGADAIMPLAAPIGSGLGIQNKINVQIIRKQTKLPLIIDAGLGQASDATIAMELGCDGVLMNTAIACAKNPILMASAMKNAIEETERRRNIQDCYNKKNNIIPKPAGKKASNSILSFLFF